jgi:cyanophycinase-like exopeptidase
MSLGRLVLMGSGELAPTMVSVHRAAMSAAGTTSVTVIDTPFGFQENAEVLTERIVDYFVVSLQADVKVTRLRSLDDPPADRARAVASATRARYLFTGPGSPSYALDVWRQCGMGDIMRGVIAAGGTVSLASAAALTAGIRTIPVYEIYKVGAEPHWLAGLDLTSEFGLPLVVVPHWNNSEGGNHDTSRCYIGRRRLAALERELDVGILGIDEHTAVTLDFGSGAATVAGVGEVTLQGIETVSLADGDRIDLAEMARILSGARRVEITPTDPPSGGFHDALAARDVDRAVDVMLAAEAEGPGSRAELQAMIVELGDAARSGVVDPRQVVGGFVGLLLDLRDNARREGRYEEADRIRDRLGDLGVEVRDTADGVEWYLT